MKRSEHTDIFDKIMTLPVLRIFEPFYRKNKQALLYLFFGGIAFFMNIILFYVLNELWGINELIANVLAWVVCATFQFFTNRIWAFHAETSGAGDFIRQMISFYGSCLFTLILEEIIIFVFITKLGYNTMIVKLVAQVVDKNGVNFEGDSSSGSIVISTDGASEKTVLSLASLESGDLYLEPGSYRLVGCPENGGMDLYRLWLGSESGDIVCSDNGDGIYFIVTEGEYFGLSLDVFAGVEMTDLEFEPTIYKIID